MFRDARPSRSMSDLAVRCLKALGHPSRANLLALAEASHGRWATGLILIWATSLIVLALDLQGYGGALPLIDLVMLPLAASVLAAAWAGAVQAMVDRLTEHRRSLFEFLLMLTAAWLIVVSLASRLAAPLATWMALLNTLFLLYWLFLMVLGIRAVAGVSFAKATAISGLSLPVALVAAFMLLRIIVGMPGFFERGALLV